MKFHTPTIVASFFLLVAQANALALTTSPNNKSSSVVNRRAAFTGVTTTAAVVVAVTAATGGSLLAPTAAMAASPAASGAEAFVGTFTDPINHPGGKRTIKLLDGEKVGDYQLAEVLGGGGRGEPESYVLPAAIIGDRTIVIDFSPKGGPRDFVGVLDKGDIKFVRDGNRWPRQ